MKSVKKIYLPFFILLLITATFIAGCNYSFTGSSVPPHLATVAIPSFIDRSGSGEADLSQKFTNTLIQKFTDDNSLQVTDKSNADALVECTVQPFQDVPNVVGGGETIETRRITITVKVLYKDLVERKKIFEKNFSNYGDYETSAGDILTAKSAAIEEAIERLTEDILLGVVSNW